MKGHLIFAGIQLAAVDVRREPVSLEMSVEKKNLEGGTADVQARDETCNPDHRISGAKPPLASLPQ